MQLAARQLTKKFSGVTALRDVSFDLHPGEIHALCGENGAGKSTLIKLLSGIHPHGSYEGALIVDGQPARFASIRDAEAAGIAVIYQELALVDELTVAENIFLGAEPRRGPFLDHSRMIREARDLVAKFGVTLDVESPCAQLGVGQKQLVEILRALRKKSRLLILDEPTAALAEHEVQVLLRILRDLRASGMACIYISHKLDEVFALADRITVLRDGASVFTTEAKNTTQPEIIRHMVGREITDLFPRKKTDTPASRAPILRVGGLTVADPATGQPRLRDLTFAVAPGEVLGIGGLMGSGRTELLMHLFGAWGRRTGGSVQLGDRAIGQLPPRQMLAHGVALVTEDRRRLGLVMEQDIAFNLSLSSLDRITRSGFIQHASETVRNTTIARTLRIKTPHLGVTVGRLSGGNQQKVVLGKALLAEPSLILLDEPTRGIDVGAKLEIYELINDLTAAGKAVILVSSELPELLGMSDRILMLHQGQLGGEFPRQEATQEKLMQAAMGRK